jgi:5-methyltetrahydropteroyltriglutamate--homocysteine methyltransferase
MGNSAPITTHNLWTYSALGLPNTAADGSKIPFSAGHVRRMLGLTAGPFRYKVYADCYLDVAKRYAHMALKQGVILPSALSLMYPAEDIAGYSSLIDDLLREHVVEIRRCFDKGAQKVPRATFPLSPIRARTPVRLVPRRRQR